MSEPITFQSPLSIKVAVGGDRFWRHFDTTQSTSILKFGSSYQAVQNPSDEQIRAADVTYLGGHVYVVSASEAAALVAAGYGSGLGGVEFGFGAGLYGSGDYSA